MPDVSLRFKGESRSAVRAANDVTESLKRVEGQSKETHHHFAALAASMSKVALAAGAAVAATATAAGGLVAVTGFRLNMLMEQSEIGMTTMLGSAEKAKAFLDELQAFAAKTPFEFPALVQTSQRLMAMGFAAEKVVPTLTSIGDAVAAMGGNPEMLQRVTTAMGQMLAKGKVSGEEMRQLAESGIPAWQMLADKIGLTIPEAMAKAEKSGIDAQTAIDALTEGMDKRFGGMMERQSHTFQGLMSTIKDTFGFIAGGIMEPFYKRTVEIMQGLVDFLGTKRWKKIEEGIKAFAQTAGDYILGFFSKVWEGGKWAFGFLSNAVQAVWPTVRRVFGAISSFVSQAFAIVRRVGSRAAEGIREAFGAAWPSIVEGAEYVQHIVEELFHHVESAFDSMADTMTAAGETLKQVWVGVVEIAMVQIGRLIEGFTVVKSEAVAIWATVIQQFTLFAQEIGPDTLQIILDIGTAFVMAWTEMEEALVRFLGGLVRTTLPLLRGIAVLLANLLGPADKVAKAFGGWKLAIEGVIIAMAAFKARFIALRVYLILHNNIMVAKMVLTHQIGAAAVANAWRAALVATGWGALAIAAGMAAAYIITHWKQVKAFFTNWRGMLNALKVTIVEIGKGVVGWMILPFTTGVDLLLRLIEVLLRKVKGIPLIGKAIPDGVVSGVKSAREALEGFQKDLLPDLGKIKKAYGDAAKTATDSWKANFDVSLMPGVDPTKVGPRSGGASPIAGATAKSIIGRPGQGTHNAADWQSRNAIDIRASANSPVYAPCDGVIRNKKENPPGMRKSGVKIIFGSSLYIQGAGVLVFITHLAKIGVNESQIVKKGDLIGTVYDAGAGSHIHVALEEGDPEEFLGFAAENPPPSGSKTLGATGGDAGGAAATGGTPGSTATTVKKATKATVRAVTAMKTDIGKATRELAGVVDPKIKDKIHDELVAIGAKVKQGISSDKLASLKSSLKTWKDATAAALKFDDLVGLVASVKNKALAEKLRERVDSIRKAILKGQFTKADAKRIEDATKLATNALKYEGLIASFAKAKATVSNLMKEGLLSKEQIREWAASAAEMVRIKKAIEKDGFISADELDRITDVVGRAIDLQEEFVKQTEENARAAWEAARDLASGWLEMIGSAVEQAGLSVEKMGGFVDQLRRLGVIVKGTITSNQFASAVETYSKNALRLAGSMRGLTAEVIEALKADAATAKLVMEDYIGTLVDGISQARGKVDTAWSKFADLAMRAFDKAHERMRSALKAALTFDGVEVRIGEGDLTPGEKALKAVQDRLNAISLKEQEIELRRAVVEAKTMKDRQKALLALQEFYLSAKARAEREAADKMLKEEQDAFDDRSSEQRQAFQNELEAIGERMREGKLAYADGLNEVMALFATYQIPFEQQSDVLGKALQDAMLSAFTAIEVAMDNLSSKLAAFVTELQAMANKAQNIQTALAVSPSLPSGSSPVYSINPQDYLPPGVTGPAPTVAAIEEMWSLFRTSAIKNMGFAQGGIIGGTYVPTDSFVARVSGGEMVLTPKQQANLFALAQGGGVAAGGSSPMIVNVYPQGSVIAERDLGTAIRASLAPIMRRNGRRPV